MKKYLIILILFFSGLATYAQDEGDDDRGAKIRDRMREYIQNRLSLSKSEAEKFTPVFLRYFHEFRQVHREYKGDNLILKQKIIDLRIRYRTEFRQIMDEPRANKVFVYEDEFRRKAIQILETRKDRLGEKGIQRNRSLLQ
ncbi:MAG TPA: hypothetical protein VGQ09_07135 [Chitinophagaceae bacterium]|jgi:hypothetical protein|nr:hypothetical protein [Chitinophagaceae bacterium]